MDAVLRQSKSMCPFLKKTSPATLRSLSTSSRGGGSMSNLQTIARRCPIMGKALAVQTAKSGRVGLGGAAALGAIRAFSGKSGKARIHTSQHRDARAVEDTLFGRENGMFCCLVVLYPTNNHSLLPASQANPPASPPFCCQIRLRGILQCRT